MNQTKKKNKWFLREPSVTSKGRLFCLPYSGCGASMYREWPQYIGEIEVCPVQFPGRENRYNEQNFTSYEEVADQMIENLLPYMDKPFAFFGHCGSALPSYEVSASLQRSNHPQPSHLFISSQVSPKDGPCGRFLTMNDEELYEELKALIVNMGGTPLPDLLELNLSVLRSDVEANKKYKPHEITTLDFPITVIGWDKDNEVDIDNMNGWKEYGNMNFVTLEGDHYQFLHAPDELIQIINQEFQVK